MVRRFSPLLLFWPTSNLHETVHIFRTVANIVNGISSNAATQYISLSLSEAKVLDIKFLYEDSLLVLLSLKGKPNHHHSRHVIRITNP
jgi:hypothetical protein